jgi:hypothetical protein
MPYVLWVITIFLLCFVVAIVAYVLWESSTIFNQISSIGAFYLNLIEGVRIRTYYIDGRCELINAIQVGILDDAYLAGKGVPSLMQYLLAPSKLVTLYDQQQLQLLQGGQHIKHFYSSLLTPVIVLNLVSVDMQQFLSLAKSYNYESMGYNASEVASNYPWLLQTNNLMSSATSTAVRDLVNSPFKLSTIDYLNMEARTFILVVTLFAAALVGLWLAFIVQLRRQFIRKQEHFADLITLPATIFVKGKDECSKALAFLSVHFG